MHHRSCSYLSIQFPSLLQNQHERSENSQLRAENEKLRAENMRYKEALTNASCPNCGGPAALGEMSFDEHHLRMENVRLREEVLLLFSLFIGFTYDFVIPARSPDCHFPHHYRRHHSSSSFITNTTIINIINYLHIIKYSHYINCMISNAVS
jgi:hypothetical protein